MEHAEFLCVLANVAAGALCYLSGWTSRALWSALAVGITVIQISVSRSFACTAAMVAVCVLCGLAGRFDRRR